jgi:N-glycosylase/DNA lyase
MPAALPCPHAVFPVSDYDLAATLNSGQVFRWDPEGAAWIGVLGNHWVRLRAAPGQIIAETALPVAEWTWLTNYLQLGVALQHILSTFPDDEPMRAAVLACRGLHLLRQEPWECLASFILSSTKQIVQIRQIVALLCSRFGKPLEVPAGQAPAFSFPEPAVLAALSERDLRDCKMGFRAPYLRGTAGAVQSGELDLASLSTVSCDQARAALMALPGVGRKIADCVLLFAYGFQQSFPVDVWVLKALRQLYFRGRRPTLRKLHEFSATHFGPNAGYAQQYLFHYMRTHHRGGVAPYSLDPAGGAA